MRTTVEVASTWSPSPFDPVLIAAVVLVLVAAACAWKFGHPARTTDDDGDWCSEFNVRPTRWWW